MNGGEHLPANAMLVTMDVSSLFTVRPQEDGPECLEQKLKLRENQQVPTFFLMRILNICYEFNIILIY